MLYTVIIKGYRSEQLKNRNRIRVDSFVSRFSQVKVSNPTYHCPYVVVRGVSEKIANNLSDYLEQYGCIIEINKSQATAPSQFESKLAEFFKSPGDVRCPICGSTSITTGARGYSLLTGFIGSNRTVNRCAKCGNTWTPGR